MNTRKNRRRKKRASRIICIIILAAMLICSVGAISREDVRFAIDDCVTRLKTNEIRKVTESENIDLVDVTMDEIKTHNNITFNETMLLVNEEHRLSENYEPNCTEYEARDVTVSENVIPSFNKLSQALYNETGETLYISSAFRSFERQKEIKAEEGDIAQNPGASEHQTGLAVDVYVKYFAGKSFTKSDCGTFINRECGNFGFIIRYPVYGKVQTGIAYEPWHLRYVGLPHSKIISGSFITFEKYIEYFEPGKFYTYENYIITRQPKDGTKIPQNFESAVVSEDNTGYLFMTFNLD